LVDGNLWWANMNLERHDVILIVACVARRWRGWIERNEIPHADLKLVYSQILSN
jgi:hypothetical protein